MNPQIPSYTPPKKESKLPLIIVSLLFVLALAFGIWAYGQMQSTKTTSNKKTTEADSKLAQAQQLLTKADQEIQAPYKTYRGSATYGTVTFDYPKNWSAYDDSTSDEPINAYFYTDIVPSTDSNASYPLRVELVSTDYAQVIQQYTEQVSAGSLKAAAYIPPKLKNVANIQPGTRFDGDLSQGDGNPQQGALVVLKVRDKTLEVYSQTANSVTDLTNIVLASLSYVP